jgi:hypothetical protein
MARSNFHQLWDAADILCRIQVFVVKFLAYVSKGTCPEDEAMGF